MENLRFAIAAGETKVFQKAGRYLEIIDAIGAVDIGLYDSNGSQADDGRGLLSGTYMETQFSAFEITSATAQTVELFLTDTRGGTRRQPGSVRVIDEITDQITHWGVNPPLAVSGTVFAQIVAPAVNTKGLIIRGVNWAALAGVGASATCAVGIQAMKSAPVDFNTPVQRYSVSQAFSNNGVNANGGDVHFNKMLPPGWGLYYWYSVGSVAAQSLGLALEYELL